MKDDNLKNRDLYEFGSEVVKRMSSELAKKMMEFDRNQKIVKQMVETHSRRRFDTLEDLFEDSVSEGFLRRVFQTMIPPVLEEAGEMLETPTLDQIRKSVASGEPWNPNLDEIMRWALNDQRELSYVDDMEPEYRDSHLAWEQKVKSFTKDTPLVEMMLARVEVFNLLKEVDLKKPKQSRDVSEPALE